MKGLLNYFFFSHFCLIKLRLSVDNRKPTTGTRAFNQGFSVRLESSKKLPATKYVNVEILILRTKLVSQALFFSTTSLRFSIAITLSSIVNLLIRISYLISVCLKLGVSSQQNEFISFSCALRGDVPLSKSLPLF